MRSRSTLFYLTLLSVTVLWLGCARVSAQTSPAGGSSEVPQFKDYPAGELYKGATAPLVLAQKDQEFRGKLRAAAKSQKPNFAGHYILTTWGCGGGCVMGAVIDARTGKVYWWEFTVCCWPETDDNFKPIDFRADSRLIIFSGLRNEKEGDDGAHFYVFDNGQFKFLKTKTKN